MKNKKNSFLDLKKASEGSSPENPIDFQTLMSREFDDLPQDIKEAFRDEISSYLIREKKLPENYTGEFNLKGADLEKLADYFLRYIKQGIGKPTTFAIPSHDVMFTLLALFSGKPEKIPRKLLLKPLGERTPEEQQEADAFLDSIISYKTTYDPDGKTIKESIALVSDNKKVEADAGIDQTLFALDERVREESLAIHIKKTYGPLGLRHLLGLIIGLEDGGRTGTFRWTVNDHLERLGLKRMQGGAYPPEEKRTATDIVRIFASLFITARSKDHKGKETITGKRLFSMDSFYVEKFQDEIVNETIELRATDFWYRNAFHPEDGKSPQYTKLLREVVSENHRNHALTIYLTPLLAIWWRMNPERKLSVTSIMDWCNLDYSLKNHNRMEDLRTLETELNYMKGKGYLGDWANSGENALPSNCKTPLDCKLTLYPPDWLRDELKVIKDKKEKHLQAIENKKRPGTSPVMSFEKFAEVFQKTGLSRNQFASNLGKTPQMIGYILNGKKKVSRGISDKIREIYPELQGGEV